MLNERIKSYIADAGLKQSAIADKANISQSTFSTMLSGKRKITAEEYFAICKALGVGLETFIA